MNIPKLNDNLNTIQSLPDSPTMQPSELKSQFDKAANIIKNFLNNILAPELEKVGIKRNIKIDGAVKGNADFDGTTDITIPIADLDVSKANIGILSVIRGGTGNSTNTSNSCTGNSATSTKLVALRNLLVTGAVTGSVDFDGSKDVAIVTTQSNIQTLTGSILVQSESTTEISINYPAGYNKDNSIVISSATRSFEDKGWNYGLENNAIDALLSGGAPRRIILDSTNIKVGIYNFATSVKTCYYKIVLMKTV